MEELVLPIVGVVLGIAGILALRRETSKLDKDKEARKREQAEFLEKHGKGKRINAL
ncbi:hypothetical protein [Leisingera sp. McT4-56]|uniref:hypothetical protein n=1 Tax=Leisingera sp. McT4-56 TaxID=2881255 RepID=UPI001CF9080F|nr:hypothetical protein [Leisingera sp. McT4-56]MCB4458033.1 hypothetical protein [Leisingera sp. McT4-56]